MTRLACSAHNCVNYMNGMERGQRINKKPVAIPLHQEPLLMQLKVHLILIMLEQ